MIQLLPDFYLFPSLEEVYAKRTPGLRPRQNYAILIPSPCYSIFQAVGICYNGGFVKPCDRPNDDAEAVGLGRLSNCARATARSDLSTVDNRKSH